MEQSMDCDEAPAALSQNGSWCASCPGRFAESVWHARMKLCTRCCELPRFLRSSFLDALIEPDCDLLSFLRDPEQDDQQSGTLPCHRWMV